MSSENDKCHMKVIPSPLVKRPSDAMPTSEYFNGGFTAEHHGSRKRGNIDAIQVCIR